MTKILTNDEINQFKKDGAIFLKGKFFIARRVPKGKLINILIIVAKILT